MEPNTYVADLEREWSRPLIDRPTALRSVQVWRRGAGWVSAIDVYPVVFTVSRLSFDRENIEAHVGPSAFQGIFDSSNCLWTWAWNTTETALVFAADEMTAVRIKMAA